MKICMTTPRNFLVVAALTALGTANAAQVQYDFSTNVTILGTNVPGEVNVNNATLSFVVDWFDIDDSGPTITANGNIVSIFATIPTNSTDFDSALLNDDTASALSPYFSTVGLDTSLLSEAEDTFSALAGGPAGIFPNGITATDPFGINPIFGGGFVDSNVSGVDLDTGAFLERSYSFAMLADGTGETYSFVEEITNSYILSPTQFGTESVSISYELGQYLGTATVVPIPAAAPLGLLGMGIVGWLRCRKRRLGELEKQ